MSISAEKYKQVNAIPMVKFVKFNSFETQKPNKNLNGQLFLVLVPNYRLFGVYSVQGKSWSLRSPILIIEVIIHYGYPTSNLKAVIKASALPDAFGVHTISFCLGRNFTSV